MRRIKDSLNDPKPVFFDEVHHAFPRHGRSRRSSRTSIPACAITGSKGSPEIQRAIDDDENQVGSVQFSWVGRHVPRARQGIDMAPPEHAESLTPSRFTRCRSAASSATAWGTVDGWRRPRPEYWLSKKLYSAVQIDEKPLAIPGAGQPIVVPVRELEPVRRSGPIRLPLGTWRARTARPERMRRR